MRWIEALKLWNAQHNPGKWCVVKKGSPEYDEVKKIQGPSEKKARRGKEKKVVERPFVIEGGAPSLSAEQVRATATARAKAVREAKLAPARATAKKEKVKAFLGKMLETRRAAKAAAAEKASSKLTEAQQKMLEEAEELKKANEAKKLKDAQEKEALRKAKKTEAEQANKGAGGAKEKAIYLLKMEEVGLRDPVRKGFGSWSPPELTKSDLIARLKRVGEDTIRAAKGEGKGLGPYGYTYEPAITRTVDEFAQTLPSNKKIRASFSNAILYYAILTPEGK